MKKEDSAMLGGAIVTLLIFAYGLKTGRGWKYWVFSLLFIPYTGVAIGYALGKEDEIELCRKRECKDKGGYYTKYGDCEGSSVLNKEKNRFERPIIELKRCE